jgi:hypothetical protein
MISVLLTDRGLRPATSGIVATALLFCPIGVGRASDPLVETAIQKGAAYIERLQLQDGCWQGRGHQLGETALAGLALLAAGYPVSSPVVAAAARAVRQLASANQETYEVSLAVMFLDQVAAQSDSELIAKLGARLSAGQTTNGCWTYSLASSVGNGDNSNTQFAVLACWICRRHGAAMDDTLLRADRYFRLTGNRTDGGWGYTPGGHSTPTMTCAGLVALAAERGVSIERSQLQPTETGRAPRGQDGPQRDLNPDKNDPVVTAALNHLGGQLRLDQIEAQSKPIAGFYFYWSLERVGVIYGLTHIGGVDWYAWGVERLLPKQRQDGGWGSQDCVDTAFSILFLSRSNVTQDLTNVIEGWEHGAAQLQSPTQEQFLRVERKRVPQTRGTNK